MALTLALLEHSDGAGVSDALRVGGAASSGASPVPTVRLTEVSAEGIDVGAARRSLRPFAAAAARCAGEVRGEATLILAGGEDGRVARVSSRELAGATGCLRRAAASLSFPAGAAFELRITLRIEDPR